METQKEIYNTVIYDEQDFLLNINPNSGWTFDTGKNPPQMFHEDIEIKYILSDTALFYVNDTVYTLKKGDILIINPYDFHSNISIDGKASKYHLYIFKTNFLFGGEKDNNIKEEIFNNKVKFKHVIEDKELANYLLQINKEYQEKNAFYKETIRYLLTLFFIKIYRCYLESNEQILINSDIGKKYALLEPAFLEIHNNYFKPFSLTKLASLCTMSDSYFCHLFKSATGNSPIDYINTYRIKIADKLLETSNTPASEIATICGFNDPNYFYRCYKKVFRCSVGERRKIKPNKN